MTLCGLAPWRRVAQPGPRRSTWGLAFGLVALATTVALARAPPLLVFVLAALAIVPLAYLMGIATEELGKHAGPGVGGLLNATFGNAVELIIGIAILAGSLTATVKAEVVKASITGSILGNLLLILGLSMFVGGLRFAKQAFSREAAGVQVTMLVLAVVALVMPSLFALTFLPGTPGYDPAALRNETLFIAAILMAGYAAGIVFSLKTHRNVFNPEAHEPEPPRWSKRRALAVLAGATALVAAMSEILVLSLDGVLSAVGLTPLFVGVIVLAIVGNAAEHGAAILMAARNHMDLSVGIATSSSTQIALFVAPFLIFVSFALGSPMTLDFELFELVAIGLSVAIVANVAGDGTSNWYEGFLLLMVYAVFAIGFYFHP